MKRNISLYQCNDCFFIFAQVAIGKSNISNTSVSLEFGTVTKASFYLGLLLQQGFFVQLEQKVLLLF